MSQQKQNSNLQNILLLAAIALLAYIAWMMSGDTTSSYRAPVQPVQQQPETGSVIIQEQPAVIIATGAPPSIPVAAPTATTAPTAVPTHPPLPGSMQEAADMGYWPMPITPAQFEQCQADSQVNPACQFYVEVSDE